MNLKFLFFLRNDHSGSDMNKEYKSPPHKLIKFFKESRDAWEENSKEEKRGDSRPTDARA